MGTGKMEPQTASREQQQKRGALQEPIKEVKTKPIANDGLKGFYRKAMVIDSTFGNDQSLYYNNMYST